MSCTNHIERKGVLQCVAVCCSVLQCVAVCCSVLQCVHREKRQQSNSTRTHKFRQHVGLFCMSLLDFLYIHEHKHVIHRLMFVYIYTNINMSYTMTTSTATHCEHKYVIHRLYHWKGRRPHTTHTTNT